MCQVCFWDYGFQKHLLRRIKFMWMAPELFYFVSEVFNLWISIMLLPSLLKDLRQQNIGWQGQVRCCWKVLVQYLHCGSGCVMVIHRMNGMTDVQSCICDKVALFRDSTAYVNLGGIWKRWSKKLILFIPNWETAPNRTFFLWLKSYKFSMNWF